MGYILKRKIRKYYKNTELFDANIINSATSAIGTISYSGSPVYQSNAWDCFGYTRIGFKTNTATGSGQSEITFNEVQPAGFYTFKANYILNGTSTFSITFTDGTTQTLAKVTAGSTKVDVAETRIYLSKPVAKAKVAFTSSNWGWSGGWSFVKVETSSEDKYFEPFPCEHAAVVLGLDIAKSYSAKLGGYIYWKVADWNSAEVGDNIPQCDSSGNYIIPEYTLTKQDKSSVFVTGAVLIGSTTYIAPEVANYVLKRKIRKYYKYIYTDWTQPVLSSNGTIGGNSFAVSGDSSQTRPPYLAFNNNTGYANNNAYMSNNVSSGFICWYNPNPLKITNIRVMNYSPPNAVKDYIVQGSNDNSTWADLKSGTNTTSAQQAVWNIALSDNSSAYKYHRILVKSAYSNHFEICLITLTAQQASDKVEVSLTDDWDFYEKTTESYVIGRK